MTKRIARCRDVARRLLGMESSNWRMCGRVFEGILMVKISLEQDGDPGELPENELAANMQKAASEVIGASLQPEYFIDVPMVKPTIFPDNQRVVAVLGKPDMRTKQGREHKKARGGAK